MKTMQQEKAKIESELQKMKADTVSRDQLSKAIAERDQLEKYVWVIRCTHGA